MEILFEQIDASRYMIKFQNVDKHIPNLIADELNNFFSDQVAFAATRRPDLDKPNVEMEVHLISSLSDVAALIQYAAQSVSLKMEALKV